MSNNTNFEDLRARVGIQNSGFTSEVRRVSFHNVAKIELILKQLLHREKERENVGVWVDVDVDVCVCG